jgi:hypothetical protein
MKYSTSSYFFDSKNASKKTAKPLHETARYKTQQAVIEWGWDAKIGERRGGDW